MMLEGQLEIDARQELTGGHRKVPAAATWNGPDRQEIEMQLSRLLDNGEFRKSKAASQFLKYVVVEALDGRAERLKSYTIATMALGRSTDFDPQINSVVRVQAKRLRALLHTYYLGPGRHDPVRIELPVGRYQPVFSYSFMPPINDETRLERASSTTDAPLRSWQMAVMVAVILFAILSGLTLGRGSPWCSPGLDRVRRPAGYRVPSGFVRVPIDAFTSSDQRQARTRSGGRTVICSTGFRQS